MAIVAVLAGLAAAPPGAGAEMRSTRLGAYLCKTVGGGRFVPIPGFPGERIDRRLLNDIAWMKRRYRIFITDGYSTSPVHAPNGEHPIGLATDIVPNRAKGGTWGTVGALARLAEPRQDHPRAPWRWVGWNGDAGHGRGDHLHLSWMHSDTPPRHPARVVYTRKCPTPPPETSGGHRSSGPTGGTSPSGGGSSGGGTSSGGTSPPRSLSKVAPPVPELN